MKTADEMFEELEYDEKQDYGEVELYRDSKECKYIQFDIYNKTICKINEYDNSDVLDVTIAELQAINKKCQELGWI